MHKKKYCILAASVFGIFVLFVAGDAIALVDSCNGVFHDKKGDTNFTVSVDYTVVNGVASYVYTVSPEVSANKLFVWVRRGLNSDPNYSANRNGDTTKATYVMPGDNVGGFPPDSVWKSAVHEDGVVWTAIATDNTFEIKATEVFKPDESKTTVLVGISNDFAPCGPILGPKYPLSPSFNSTAFASSETHLCFKNGCCYFATTDETTGQVTNLVTDPATPSETVCGAGGCKACEVDTTADCAAELDVPDCGRVLLTAPLQSEDGGTCYYPTNIKFTC